MKVTVYNAAHNCAKRRHRCAKRRHRCATRRRRKVFFREVVEYNDGSIGALSGLEDSDIKQMFFAKTLKENVVDGEENAFRHYIPVMNTLDLVRIDYPHR